MQSARHEKLVALVNEKGMLSTGELCGLLGVSQATVRRDITELDRQNRIRKTHGGAMAHIRHATEDMPMPMRRHTRREEKARIAAAALELVGEGESVFLDSGTTTYELAVKLRAFRNLTILTNDIDIAFEVANSGTNNLIVAGGVRKKSSATLIGHFTEQMLSQLHVDRAFLSVDAVDIDSGFMDYNTDEIPIKRVMIRNARSRVVLCDHAKFSNAAFVSICPLDAADLIITGRELDMSIAERIRQAGTQVLAV
ncbi:MAG: DeoR/GlpR transcriptional regulator [Clostridiales bacterium]|nr:DeoR/GlpR transcriptional regulator [Clostridiales bacterium]